MDQLWGLDRLASLNPAAGVRAWYGYDGQGTARQLLNDAGHVTASASYDPYGGPEGTALPSPFGYTGELTDPATGSQYLRARWYRPGQGAMLGVDPALDSTGQPYSYANDNPTNGSDPSGQCTVHLASTEYSYLGAYGIGPCPRDFASQIGAVFRQGHGIPCLYVTPTGGLEVLAPGQTQTNSEPPPSGGGGTTAIAAVGAGVIGLGEATLPVTGSLAGAGPPGWIIDALIFVGVVVVAIGIGVFVGTQATSTTSQQPESINRMRVQLQDDKPAALEHTWGLVAVNTPEFGVTTLQIRTLLADLYAGYKVAAPWFPSRLEKQLIQAIVLLSQSLKRFPPVGVAMGGNIDREKWLDRGVEYRVDIENERGLNLRS